LQLEDFFDYKNQLMEDILTTESIVRLLDEEISMDDAAKLAYSQVFPCEYVPETVQGGKTYICFDVDILKSSNSTFYIPTIYIWIFAHRSQLRLPDGGGVRTDTICSELCKKINGSRKYGLGELDLYSAKRFAPMTDYQGKVLCFYAKDFNRVYDPSKPTPSNRKAGV
jgi:hypothetical protein